MYDDYFEKQIDKLCKISDYNEFEKEYFNTINNITVDKKPTFKQCSILIDLLQNINDEEFIKEIKSILLVYKYNAKAFLKDKDIINMEKYELLKYIKALIKPEDKLNLYKTIFKNYIEIGKPELSNEILEDFINEFIENSNETFNIKERIKYNGLLCDDQKERLGCIHYNKINISPILLKNIIENNNNSTIRYYHFVFLIHVLYHEITHKIQDQMIKNIKYFTKELLLLTYDKILSNYNNEYYKQNYNNISFENHAEIHSKRLTKSYMKDLLKETYDEELFDNAFKLYDNESEIRKIDDEYINSSKEIFKILKEKPNFLDIYPQLNLEFKNEDGKIKYISSEELETKYYYNEQYIKCYRNYKKENEDSGIENPENKEEVIKYKNKLNISSLKDFYLHCIAENHAIKYVLKNRGIIMKNQKD